MLFPLVNATFKKKSQSRPSLQNGRVCFTGTVTLSSDTFTDNYLCLSQALPTNPKTKQTEMLRKGVNSTTETRKGHLPPEV